MDPEEEAVSFAEFLALARDEGLVSLEVHVIQAADPASGRGALVSAVARSSHNAFAAVGEATAATAPSEWHPYLTTLAELRAKARALRELTGLEHAVLEELSVPYQSSPAAAADHHQRAERSPLPAAVPVAPRPAQSQPAASRPAAATGTSHPPGKSMAEPRKTEAADEQEDQDEMYEPPRPAAARPSQVSESAQTERPDEGAEPVGGGMESGMEAKLLRLAMTIAEREGENLSEAEARKKLDDFFMRAFKHPLSRATQQEGQRVVHRLASDLARLRPRSADE